MNFIKRVSKKVRDYFPMMQNPAGERNKEPLLEVLEKYIDVNTKLSLLEISSGTGLHASYFAESFPNLTFQPSEFETGMFKSIKAYKLSPWENRDLKNVLDPIFIDISKDLQEWEAKFQDKPLRDCQNSFDYMLNINMMHISPFTCTEGLFKNSGILLKPGGILFTYGPYSVNGVLEPESNISFDRSLRSKDPAWGVRDVAELEKIAAINSLQLSATFNLPSNNKCLVWKKNQ